MPTHKSSDYKLSAVKYSERERKENLFFLLKLIFNK